MVMVAEMCDLKNKNQTQEQPVTCMKSLVLECSYICDVNSSLAEGNLKLPPIWTVFNLAIFFQNLNSNIFVMFLTLFFHQVIER